MPNPYAILGAIGLSLALIIGAFFYGEHIEALSWKAATAKLEASAEHTLREANDKAALKDAAMASLSRNLDEQHAKYMADQESARGDFERELTQRVRDAERRQSGRCQLPSPSIDPGKPQDSAAGSLDGLSGIDVVQLQAIADNANKLAATVRTCVSWANQIGK